MTASKPSHSGESTCNRQHSRTAEEDDESANWDRTEETIRVQPVGAQTFQRTQRGCVSDITVRLEYQ